MKTNHDSKVIMRILSCLLVLLLLLFLSCCGREGKKFGDISSPKPHNISSSTLSVVEDSKVKKEELIFKISDDEPQVKCVASTNKDGSVSSIVITDTKTGEHIQTLFVPDNTHFGSRLMYFMDVTFTGENSLLVPNYDSAYFVKYYAFRWDNSRREFVIIEGFEEISNPVINHDERNIYSHWSGDHTTNYFIYSYNGNDLLTEKGLIWYPFSEDNGMQSMHFIEYGVNCEKAREFTLPLDESFNFDRSDERFIEYTKENSSWDIYSDKWDFQQLDNI